MKYGRHQIDKAGDILISSKNTEEVSTAIEKINDWRTLHLPALDALQNTIISLLENEKIKIDFSSRRLKRLNSILYKLDLNPKMRLGGMQDIGGLRIVVPDIKTHNQALSVLRDTIPSGFELVKIMNYIETEEVATMRHSKETFIGPKPTSGYRSVHIIYKYVSNNKDTHGVKIELQLRTKLQHNWAMAVETAGLITKTALKSSQGADEWLDFFKVVSSLFAIKEKMPILSEHIDDGYGMKELMKLLYNLNKDYNLADTLKALDVSNIHARNENYKDGYYILNINFLQRIVNVEVYPKEKKDDATIKYAELEASAQDNVNAVVFVSVPKMRELQEAYPSYFLDTKQFLLVLDTMINNCKKQNWT